MKSFVTRIIPSSKIECCINFFFFFFLIEIIFWSNKNLLDMKRENSAQFDFNSSINWKKGINISIHKIELY